MSNNQCRICFNEDGLLKNVFDTEIQVNDKKSLRLREIFKAVTNISIYSGDLFPETICEHCISELSKAFRIRIQAKKSDFILRKSLSHELVKSEVKSDNFDDENELSKSLDDFELDIFNDCDEEDVIQFVKKEEEIEETVYDMALCDERKETTPSKIVEVDIDEQLADYPELHYSDSESDDAEDIKKMNTVTNIKGKFVCYICDETIETFRLLNDHKKLNHSITFDRGCVICFEIIKSEDYYSHLKTHKNHKPNECLKCNQTFKVSESLYKHFKQRTCEASMNLLKRSFPSRQIKPQDKVKKPINLVKCNYCDLRFNFDNLSMHTKLHTGNPVFHCLKCNYFSPNSESFKAHKCGIAKNTDFQIAMEKYFCTKCCHVYLTEDFLKRHIIHAHENLRGENAANEIRSSGIILNNLCQVCGKQFVSSKYLKYHMAVHTGEFAFKCDQCEKSFNTSSSLSNHGLRNHKPKVFECEFQDCDKKYAALSFLNKHIERAHDKIRRFLCDKTDCGKAYATHSGLAEHKERVHSNVRHQCLECDKLFGAKTLLKKHVETVHTSIKRFQCENCLFGTNRKIRFREHLMKKHQMEWN